MKAALVSIEDRRFYEHHGVDWKGTIRALISNQTGEDAQGASTLTQQYVKNYLINVVYRDQTGQEGEDPQKKMERQRAQEQIITRKLQEARLAVQLEQKMSKDEILTGYLNVVEFTNEIFGIGAASQAYFGTTPDKLTRPQAALLAGMVNNPSHVQPVEAARARRSKRRNLVIDTMVETSRLSEEDAEAAKKEPLGVRAEGEPQKPAANCVGAGPEYGFFCQYVEEYLREVGFSGDQLYTGGYTIKTTFDAGATQIAKRAVEAQVPKDTEGVNNSMAIVRPGAERHEVVALVSNRDYGLNVAAGQTTLGYPYDVMNKFGAGSNYKIFSAAAFLEKGGGIMNTIQTPRTHVSNVFTGGAKSCPRTEKSGDADTRKYCLSNLGENTPSSMTLQTGAGHLPEHRLRDPRGTDRHGRGRRHGEPAGSAQDDGDQRFRRDAEPELRHRREPGQPERVLPEQAQQPGQRIVHAEPGAGEPPGDGERGRHHHEPRRLVPAHADRRGAGPQRQEDRRPGAALRAGGGSGAGRRARRGHEQGRPARWHRGERGQAVDWDRPMIGKTGTTQVHQSSAFLGATPQLSAAVHTFADSPQPRGICLDPVRLCGDGNIFGGTVPARTWFDTMKQIHEGAPVLPLPTANDRYRNGGSDTQVPDVVGDSEQDATVALQNAGYKVDVKQRNAAAEKGTVVSQSPRGNALVGETITIHVSTGYVPPPQTEAPPPSTPPPGGPPPPGGDPPPNGPGG